MWALIFLVEYHPKLCVQVWITRLLTGLVWITRLLTGLVCVLAANSSHFMAIISLPDLVGKKSYALKLFNFADTGSRGANIWLWWGLCLQLGLENYSHNKNLQAYNLKRDFWCVSVYVTVLGQVLQPKKSLIR